MGVITAGFGTLGAVGPLLGSAIAGTASWRVSLAVAAVALLALPAVARRADLAPPRQSTPFDGRGAALLVLLATVLVLIPRFPLPAVTASLLAGVLLALHIRSKPTGFAPCPCCAPGHSSSPPCSPAPSRPRTSHSFTVPQLLHDRTGWSTSTIGTGQLVALLSGSVLSMALAVAAARLGRPRVLAILLTTGALAPLTALLTPWPSLLLPVAMLAVFTTSAGQATLAVLAGQSAPACQRPTAMRLFNLGYQLGGAFGPAIATLVVFGG
jgi:MFS family permease